MQNLCRKIAYIAIIVYINFIGLWANCNFEIYGEGIIKYLKINDDRKYHNEIQDGIERVHKLHMHFAMK